MTDIYAVLGNPIAHSKSPFIHQLFAKQTQQDLVYRAELVPLDAFAQTVSQLRAEGLKGCNVTVPFKLEAWLLADQLTPRAKDAGAVNTLVFQDGVILGDNTDGAGLVRDIQVNLGVGFAGKRVLLLGAGGAAQGVTQPILAEHPASLTICNRSIAKAQHLQTTIAPSAEVITFDDLAGRQYDIVINATSAGLTDQQLPLPNGLFAERALAYDMMYGRETPFIAFARQQGTQVADGLGMLLEQAAEAFFVWRGIRPDTAVLISGFQE